MFITKSEAVANGSVPSLSLPPVDTTGADCFEVGVYGYGATGFTVTCSKGYTYSLVREQANGSNGRLSVFRSPFGVSGGPDHAWTITPNVPAYLAACALADAYGAEAESGESASAVGVNDAPNSGPVAAPAGAEARGWMGHESSVAPSLTPGEGWTGRVNLSATANRPLAVEDRVADGSPVVATFGPLANVVGWAALVTVVEAGGEPPPPPPASLTMTTPKPFQMHRRSGADCRGVGGSTSIPVSGTCPDGAAVEASADGVTWTTMTTTGTAFTGSLPGIPAGQYTVTARLVADPGVSASAANVGVGEVVGIWGQSNASGRLEHNQVYVSGTGLKAVLYANDNAWKECLDPTDSPVGQPPSSYSTDANVGGSVWPLVATQLMAAWRCPVAFVPCAMGSTGISQWLPGTGLYSEGVARCLAAGGVGAVVWWQGETDAVNGTSESAYGDALAQIKAGVLADLGCQLLPATLLRMDPVVAPQANQDAITAAVMASGPHVYVSDLACRPEDPSHITTDAKAVTAAARWAFGVHDLLCGGA